MQVDEKALREAVEATKCIQPKTSLRAGDYDVVTTIDYDPVIRAAVIAYLESALKLGSRLTVEGVEAVVAPREPSDEMLRSALAVEFPATYRAGLRHPADGPGAREMTNTRIDVARGKYRAMLSAAGDGR